MQALRRQPPRADATHCTRVHAAMPNIARALCGAFGVHAYLLIGATATATARPDKMGTELSDQGLEP